MSSWPRAHERGVLVVVHACLVGGCARSSVFLDEPDLTRHPLLVHATPYKVSQPALASHQSRRQGLLLAYNCSSRRHHPRLLVSVPAQQSHSQAWCGWMAQVVLEEGDVLYLPAFWHHEVKSRPDASESLNIAVNYWFRNETFFAEEDEGLRAAARAQRKRPPRAEPTEL